MLLQPPSLINTDGMTTAPSSSLSAASVSAAAGFTIAGRFPVPALRLEAIRFRHPCGAEHWHLAADDDHRAFVVAFRTPPLDSTGLPHILEHTTLCGSKRFPVRDPFFQMLRRSLQTFMNAMTFPDMTAYPFASQVSKDYDNLLDVYLDAVFAPRLDPRDFSQEGHRLEPAASPAQWQRKGVVYNEMKGAMDSTDAQVEQATATALLTDTCYRHNSGGDPAAIPALKYDDLVAFHARCYRPANAVFVTYGSGDPAAIQRRIGAYLKPEGTPLPPPTVQISPITPSELDVPVPLAAGQDAVDVTATALTWVWDDSSDLDEALTAELLDRLLTGHAGAPLRLALESSGLGRSTGSTGYGSSYRNGLYTAELEGIAEADYPAFPKLVMDCLAKVAMEGVPAEEIEAALQQVELSRREIHGDHYPYGLELCFRLLGGWNHGVDPLPFLDQSAAIARLRKRALAPDFVATEVKKRLVDNQRRLWIRARPDAEFHQRRDAAEAAQVAAAISALDANGIETLREQAKILAAHQASHDDPTVLPDLELTDVPGKRRWVQGHPHGGTPDLTTFPIGTNGVLHQVAAFTLPDLDDAELDLLPLAIRTIGSLGVGDLTYDRQAARLNRLCGGLYGWTDVVADPDDPAKVKGFLFCEVKGLADRQADYVGLLAEALDQGRFDEHDRLRELVDEAVQRLHGAVGGRGNQLAARAAMRGFGGAATLAHRLGGLGRLAKLKKLAESIDEDLATGDAAVDELGSRLQKLLKKLTASTPKIALIGDAAERAAVMTALRSAWTRPASTQKSPAISSPKKESVPPLAYATATAVNYCALAFPAVTLGHPDAAPLAVATRLLTNQVLHPKLREQGGAYGGSAGYQSANAAVILSSYRDPRLAGTYADMRDALRWLRTCPDDPRMFKEAILGVMAGLDAPGSPAGEARARFSGDLKGIGPNRLDAYRANVLAVTPAALRQAAERWLPPEGGSPAVVTSAPQAEASGMGWTVEQL